MIEAVIWDFGGVLTSPPFEAFARFEVERGLSTDIIRRTNANNHWENAWAKFERFDPVSASLFPSCSLRPLFDRGYDIQQPLLHPNRDLAIRLKSADDGEISSLSDDHYSRSRGRSRRPGDPGRSCSHMAFPETKFVRLGSSVMLARQRNRLGASLA